MESQRSYSRATNGHVTVDTETVHANRLSGPLYDITSDQVTDLITNSLCSATEITPGPRHGKRKRSNEEISEFEVN